jgi:hypothetical protein
MGNAWAQAGGLSRCRGISDAASRLACYDALPLEGHPAGLAPETAVPVQQARPAPPATTFGLEDRAPATAALPALQSRIPGRFRGWGPNSRIRLENGQVWQIADESARVLDLENPAVTVRRGLMGAFYLDFEGDNRSPRVRRIR